MTITKDTVVSMTYLLKNNEGEILDQSGDEPLIYLHGHENIVPGLEKALEGLAVGATTEASVPPTEGYGEYDPKLKFAIPTERMGDEIPPLNALLQLKNQAGQTFVARVVATDSEKISLDANHPLAGEHLNFQVTITDVRKAEPEEIAHGHVHGPGGHHHH
ncbi:MAG: FKBP-type peptidyl-prolyl cis-trans isomerase [Vulcanimicrobiota bacterium]